MAQAGIAVTTYTSLTTYSYCLSPYAPELNPVEHVWDELREKNFHNLAFESLDALEDALEESLRDTENQHERIRSMVRWPWIVKVLLN